MSNPQYSLVNDSYALQDPYQPPAAPRPYTFTEPSVPEDSTMTVVKQSTLDEEEEEMLKKGMVDWNALKRKEFWIDKRMISESSVLRGQALANVQQSGISSLFFWCMSCATMQSGY